MNDVSDDRLAELIEMTIGRDTKKCLMELRIRRSEQQFDCLGGCGAKVPAEHAYCSACFLRERAKQKPARDREPPHCSSCSCGQPSEIERLRSLIEKHNAECPVGWRINV